MKNVRKLTFILMTALAFTACQEDLASINQEGRHQTFEDLMIIPNSDGEKYQASRASNVLVVYETKA